MQLVYTINQYDEDDCTITASDLSLSGDNEPVLVVLSARCETHISRELKAHLLSPAFDEDNILDLLPSAFTINFRYSVTSANDTPGTRPGIPNYAALQETVDKLKNAIKDRFYKHVSDHEDSLMEYVLDAANTECAWMGRHGRKSSRREQVAEPVAAPVFDMFR